MKVHLMITAGVLAVLAMPLAAQAQGIIRSAEEGAAAGNRAAGPVGGAVGGAVGGVVGGVEGGVKGALGIPQRTGSGLDRNRSDRAELSANQIMDQFAARTARIKADLRLTPEQEKIGRASRAPRARSARGTPIAKLFGKPTARSRMAR